MLFVSHKNSTVVYCRSQWSL